MHSMKLALFLLLFAPIAFAQELPTKGSIHDLKGKTKVYVIADAAHMKLVRKGLGNLVEVSKPSDAEFFLEYKVLSVDKISSVDMETGEVDVYFFVGNERVVAWSDSSGIGGFRKALPTKLVERFVKALTK